MEKQTTFRDRQEQTAADLNAIGSHAAQAMQHIVADAISADLHYTGGNVAAKTTTQIEVAPLRFFNAGAVYTSEQAETLNLFQHLPLTTKKCVAIVLWGETVETDVQPRDFITDLTTGATEPQAVSMTQLRKANINLLPGTESVDPQPPALQTGTLALALVYLGTNGIERIEMQEGMRLPALRNHAERLREQENWRAQAEPRISTIATDLAGLAEKTTLLVARSTVVELANDVARLKAKANLPTAYASYESDYYGNTEKTDTNAMGYNAAVVNGLIFPEAGKASAGLALFNPYDAGVKRHADDLVLPAYSEIPRIKTSGYSGDLSISQYQVQSQTIREYTTTVWDYRYGWNYNYYGGWWNSWYWKYYGYNWGWYGYYGYRVARQETHYELQTVTTSYNGAIIGQSFLVSNAMWLTKVGLQFTQIGATGDVVIAVCETDGGKPNLEKTLTRITLSRGDIVKYPTETAVPVPPVLLEAGKRYALVLITQGDHRVATVSGNDYTQGTLFFGTDGDYFTGDLTKDMMFTLYGAQFAQPRVEVVLQSISLAGGISDIHIAAPQVVPDGTELRYEMQVGGKWYPLGDEIMRLSGLPDIVPLRVVMLGTSDLAPAFRLAANAITGSRAATTFVHWSTPRALASPSSAITVQLVVAQWDAVQHVLECSLKSGATSYTPATTVVRDEPDGQARRFTFTFSIPEGVSNYQIKTSGTRTGSSAPFVVVERTDVAT